MAEKQQQKKQLEGIWQKYKVEGGRLIRSNNFCPKCGPGAFLADHGDRLTCGKCGYTIFKKKK